MIKTYNTPTQMGAESITVEDAQSLLIGILGTADKILREEGKLIIDPNQHRAVQMHFRQRIEGLEWAMGAIPSVAESEYRPIHDEQLSKLHGHITDLRNQRNAYMSFYEVRL